MAEHDDLLEKIITSLESNLYDEENSDNSDSSNFENGENCFFFDKDRYYLLNAKNINKRIELDKTKKLYVSDDKNLETVLENIRNKKETKIVIGKIVEKNKLEKNDEKNAKHILVKENEKSQELYVDITLITPDLIKNIANLTNRIIESEKEKIISKEIEKSMANNKNHSFKFKEFITSCHRISKKFLTLKDLNPVKSADMYFKMMNENFGTNVSLTNMKNIDLDEVFSSYKRDNRLIENNIGQNTGISI